MAGIVANEYHLAVRAASLRTFLNGGTLTLRLGKVSFSSTPASNLAAFTEADFAGYAGIPITGQFGAAVLTSTGLYTLTSSVFVFTCTSGSQTVYQWYIDDGVGVIMSENYIAGVMISAGTPYYLVIKPTVFAQNLL